MINRKQLQLLQFFYCSYFDNCIVHIYTKHLEHKSYCKVSSFLLYNLYIKKSNKIISRKEKQAKLNIFVNSIEFLLIA